MKTVLSYPKSPKKMRTQSRVVQTPPPVVPGMAVAWVVKIFNLDKVTHRNTPAGE